MLYSYQILNIKGGNFYNVEVDQFQEINLYINVMVIFKENIIYWDCMIIFFLLF